MKRVNLDESWPNSWKASYTYDLEEVYGNISCQGYAQAYRVRRQQALRLLTEGLQSGARILDIAAAQGNFSLTLAEMGYSVTWNDLRNDLLDYVRLKHDFGNIEFAPGNVFDLSFPARFDAVLITEIIEHVAHPDEFLSKVAELIRPGGCIVLTTPNGEYFQNTLPKFSDCPDPSVFESVQFKPNSDGHIFLLYKDEIRTLATKAGLLVEELVLFTTPITSGHLKTESLLRVLPQTLIDAGEALGQQLPCWLGRKLLIQIGARLRKPALG